MDPYKIFELALKAIGIPVPEREYRFSNLRRWRLDFAWPEHKLAVEIEGGIWIGGRHIRSASFLKDVEKYNTLALHGFWLLRFTPQQIQSGEAVTVIEKWFSEVGKDGVHKNKARNRKNGQRRARISN